MPPPSFRRSEEDPPPVLGKNESLLELRQSGIAYMPPGSWMVFLLHWLILLAFALPWSGLLVWRARRRRRAAPM